jgi:hypothetical protein
MRLALPDLPHRRVHIGVVPNLGELAVFEAIKSELRNSHPTTGRLNSLEGPPVGTSDREVHRDIVAVDKRGSVSPNASQEMRRTEPRIAPQRWLDP